MKIYTGRVRRILVYGLVFLMLGICGMIGSATMGTENDGDSDAIDESQGSRAGEPRGSTEIPGYLRLTEGGGSAHDGNYGPENSYYFYLDSTYTNFRIYLRTV